jgi:putative nucleotidyltransferase with HDIG domain
LVKIKGSLNFVGTGGRNFVVICRIIQSDIFAPLLLKTAARKGLESQVGRWISVRLFGKLRTYFRRMDLRTKVIFVFLIIMGLFVYRLSFSTHYYLVELQGQDKINENINVAHRLFYNWVEQFNLRTDSLSRGIGHMGPGPDSFNQLYLETEKWGNLRPDIFFYIDAGGNIVYSCNNTYADGNAAGAILMSLHSVKKALSGIEAAGIEILPKEMIGIEGLLEKTRILLVPTPNASQPDYHVEESAMAIVSAKPVQIDGIVTGALVAGRIINNDFELVDLLNRELNASATIFMKNIRISTTVENSRGERAIGTLLSTPVEEKVLGKGERYLGRAFVVDDWYLTAYEPIRDVENRVIGALYVGIKEGPLLVRQRAMDNELKLTLFILTLIFVLALYWLYRAVVIPIRKLSISALRFARGELEVQVPVSYPNKCWEMKKCESPECPVYGKSTLKCWLVPKKEFCKIPNNSENMDACAKCEVYAATSGNELEQMTDAFNFMAASMREYTESLNALNNELEQKNTELTDRKDELECQKEQLIALNRELEESMRALDDSQSIIYALAVAVEAKDPYTRGHSERVADFSVKLAAAVGILYDDFETIRGAALLHDIGKIGISGSILRKPTTLTAMEFQQVKKHPAIGERICSSLKFAKDMLPIIRHHHEHFNGKGYPDGLKGAKIPIMARIVAIADAFDAMTSDRPYRPGMTAEQALGVLEQGAGGQWDPELVNVFIRLIREELQERSASLFAEKVEDDSPVI